MHFTIGTTRFTVSFLFCCVLALLILFDNNVLLYSFLMVCAHESAHLLAMYCCAVKVEVVRLEPFGIIIEKQDEEMPFSSQFMITAAGCILNFLLAVLFLFLYFCKQTEVHFTLFAVNVLLFSLNVLPIDGLDGGQLLTLFLIKRKGMQKARTIGKKVSLCCCVLLFISGAIICFKIRFNPSICLISFVLFVQTLLKNMNCN